MVSIIFRDTCARPTAYASHACLLRYWGKRALNRWNQRNEKLLRESPLSYSGCSCPRIGKTIKELTDYMLQPCHPYPWQQYPTRYSGCSYSPTIGFIKPQPTRTNRKSVYQSRKEDAGRVGGITFFTRSWCSGSLAMSAKATLQTAWWSTPPECFCEIAIRLRVGLRPPAWVRVRIRI